MKIGIMGSARDFGIIDVCERIAMLHGGILVFSMQQTKLKATCTDGTKIESFGIEHLRGPKLDEIWLPTAITDETYEDLIIPSIMGDASRIHYWKELYDADDHN